jgi:hypothetical protein
MTTPAKCGETIETAELIVAIEQSWSTDFRIGVSGWCISKIGAPDQVELHVGGGLPVRITTWLPRPDIRARYPQYLETDLCGFAVQIDRMAEHCVTVRASTGAQIAASELRIAGQLPTRWHDPSASLNLWNTFVAEVNRRRLRVLEIGSRIVVPGTETKRKYFGSEYIGFDYYKDANTDVVGDVHRLSQYFTDQKFGAIFSHSVLEHLAMPWIAALEMIKLLEIGGLIFHHVPATWPPHELPADFWRISTEGLRVLFATNVGMKVEGHSCDHPLHMYLDDKIPNQEMFSMAPAYAFSAVLARKVREVDYSKFCWDTSAGETLGAENAYPMP